MLWFYLTINIHCIGLWYFVISYPIFRYNMCIVLLFFRTMNINDMYHKWSLWIYILCIYYLDYNIYIYIYNHIVFPLYGMEYHIFMYLPKPLNESSPAQWTGLTWTNPGLSKNVFQTKLTTNISMAITIVIIIFNSDNDYNDSDNTFTIAIINSLNNSKLISTSDNNNSNNI